jgi:hypothetical protein
MLLFVVGVLWSVGGIILTVPLLSAIFQILTICYIKFGVKLKQHI